MQDFPYDMPVLDARKGRHFLEICQLTAEELRRLLDSAHALKKAGKHVPEQPLSGYSLGMIFEKNSTRTRMSFETGMVQLGGHAVFLNANDLQLGRGESVADTARVLSRYVDALMLRCYQHETLLELAHYAEVPVINGLTNRSHPCQIIADLQTIEEKLGSVRGKRIAWVGDGNNMLTSWMEAATLMDFSLHIATPPAYAPDATLVGHLRQAGAELEIGADPLAVVAQADVVMTDTWVSMGDADEVVRKRDFAPYQVTPQLMASASPKAIFMHCLPAHRGEEVVDEVIDGPQSVILDEAENRLHAQKAILLWTLNVGTG